MKNKRIHCCARLLLIVLLFSLLYNPVVIYADVKLPASPFRIDDWPGITIDRK